MDIEPKENKRVLRYGMAGAILMMVIALVMSASLAYVDQPQFCGSCHSMKEVYAGFAASNHKQFTCGDCHLPQQNIVVKLSAKTKSGMSHVYHETLKDYPEPLTVTKDGKKILADNCRRCHLSTIQNTMMASDDKNCTSCHRSLVHQEMNSGKFLGKGGLGVE